MAKNPWPEQFRPKKAPGPAEVDLSRTADPLSAFNESMRVAVGMPAQQPPVMPQGESPGSVEISSEVDVSKGLSSVFPQSKELEELQQRLERRYRQPSETHIDPATGEIREYASNPATGEAEWTHYGVMPPPKAPSESPSESGSPAAGPVNWEEIDRQTREKYGLPAKQPLGDIPSGGSSPGRPTSSGTPYLPGMEPEPTPPSPPPGAPPATHHPRRRRQPPAPMPDATCSIDQPAQPAPVRCHLGPGSQRAI